MMQKCPECGSSEVVSDLAVFSDEAAIGLQLPYVLLKEPKPEKKLPLFGVSNLWQPGSAQRCAARADIRASTPKTIRKFGSTVFNGKEPHYKGYKEVKKP